MDPATGADRWTYTAQPGTTVVSPFDTTYPAVASGVVHVNLGRLLAIDGVSKRLLWTGPEGLTASPVVAAGYVLARLPAGVAVYGRPA